MGPISRASPVICFIAIESVLSIILRIFPHNKSFYSIDCSALKARNQPIRVRFINEEIYYFYEINEYLLFKDAFDKSLLTLDSSKVFFS